MYDKKGQMIESNYNDVLFLEELGNRHSQLCLGSLEEHVYIVQICGLYTFN